MLRRWPRRRDEFDPKAGEAETGWEECPDSAYFAGGGLTHEYVVSLLILTYDQLAEVESCVKPSVYSDPKNFLHPKDSLS